MIINLFRLLCIVLLLSSCSTTTQSVPNSDSDTTQPKKESLAEGQYYISGDSGITQLTLESGYNVSVIGIGRMKYGGNLGVLAAYQSEKDFGIAEDMENEAYEVLMELNQYIEETDLDYCFIQARTQGREYGTGFNKVDGAWKKFKG